jgi:hypothetical protein
MTTKTNQTHFTITTTNGTRWSATGTSAANALTNFFGNSIGLKIEKIEKRRLFSATSAWR